MKKETIYSICQYLKQIENRRTLLYIQKTSVLPLKYNQELLHNALKSEKLFVVVFVVVVLSFFIQITPTLLQKQKKKKSISQTQKENLQ